MRKEIVPIVTGALRLNGKCSNKLIEGSPDSPCVKDIKSVLTITVDTLQRALSKCVSSLLFISKCKENNY